MGFYRAKIFQHSFLFGWKRGPPSSALASLKALGKAKLIHPFASGGKKRAKSSKGTHNELECLLIELQRYVIAPNTKCLPGHRFLRERCLAVNTSDTQQLHLSVP